MIPPHPVEYFEKVGDMTFVKPEFEEKFGVPRSKRLTKTTIRLWEGGLVHFQISTEYTGKQTEQKKQMITHVLFS